MQGQIDYQETDCISGTTIMQQVSAADKAVEYQNYGEIVKQIELVLGQIDAWLDMSLHQAS